jgi:hypothetical protein
MVGLNNSKSFQETSMLTLSILGVLVPRGFREDGEAVTPN